MILLALDGLIFVLPVLLILLLVIVGIASLIAHLMTKRLRALSKDSDIYADVWRRHYLRSVWTLAISVSLLISHFFFHFPFPFFGTMLFFIACISGAYGLNIQGSKFNPNYKK